MSLKINFITKKKFEHNIINPIPSDKFFPKWFQDLPNKSSKCPFKFLNSKYNFDNAYLSFRKSLGRMFK